MTWGAPEWLWLIPLAWVVAGVSEARRERRRRALFRALGVPVDAALTGARFALVLLALSSLGVALAAPAGPASPVPATTAEAGGRGKDVILLMDVSRSMAARDVSPDRGSLGRMAALRVATGAEARVGVAAFAADAHLLVPPTEDRGLVALYAEALDPAMVTGQGSDLAGALEVSVSALPEGGTVVLISDGEGFQDDGPLGEALTDARRRGVVVHTVRVGTEVGATVPGVLTGGHTRARPELLRRIADATGGVAVDGDDGGAVGELVARLSRGAGPASPGPGAPWPVSWLAAVALILLLGESSLGAMLGRGPA